MILNAYIFKEMSGRHSSKYILFYLPSDRYRALDKAPQLNPNCVPFCVLFFMSPPLSYPDTTVPRPRATTSPHRRPRLCLPASAARRHLLVPDPSPSLAPPHPSSASPRNSLAASHPWPLTGAYDRIHTHAHLHALISETFVKFSSTQYVEYVLLAFLSFWPIEEMDESSIH
jgi:hypothetical protein